MAGAYYHERSRLGGRNRATDLPKEGKTMRKNVWAIAVVVIAIAAALLAVWHAAGLGQAGEGVVVAGAAGWLALALAGFGTLSATDPFRQQA